MFLKILLGIAIAAAIVSLLNRNSARRLESLKRSGVYPLPGQETAAHVDRLIRGNHKIEAIKVYRTIHGVGLKEAKEAVEARQAELAGSGARTAGGMRQ